MATTAAFDASIADEYIYHYVHTLRRMSVVKLTYLHAYT